MVSHRSVTYRRPAYVVDSVHTVTLVALSSAFPIERLSKPFQIIAHDGRFFNGGMVDWVMFGCVHGAGRGVRVIIAADSGDRRYHTQA